jgi:VWFA-related protein
VDHGLALPLLASLLLVTAPAPDDPPALPGPGAPPAPACAPGAPALDAGLRLAYSGREASRTRVEATLAVAASAPAGPRTYRLEGEVTRGANRVEGFRYRFLPGAARGPIELDFVRLLPAGHYRLQLELAEEQSGACFRLERELDVPALGASAGPAAAAAGPSLRIFAPADRLLTGTVRFEIDLRQAGDARLVFELDGKRVMTRVRPPWTAELDLGSAPRLHRLAVVAESPAGAELARDEVLLNAGPHRFAVGLALVADPVRTPSGIEARAQVTIPEGERLERLDLLVDGALRATLHQPPFVLPLRVPAGATWVRAVAYLEGGGAAEAVRLLGGGAGAESVDVDLVELHATVVDRQGRPLEDLRPDEIEVLEDGRPQRLRRLERVRDVPIHAAVLLDTSDSMADRLDENVRAALLFFEQVLTERDRAALITFADRPRLAVRFSGRLDRLAGGVADLSAQGQTALYDSLAFALHYFSGLGGKRALVLLSDGADTASRTSFDEVLEFARRTGVAIYPVGLGLPSRPIEPRLELDRLARETGGRVYFLERTARLASTYEEIESELRAQWLLAYQSDAAGGTGYRRIEVEVRRPGALARTAAGYYP